MGAAISRSECDASGDTLRNPAFSAAGLPDTLGKSADAPAAEAPKVDYYSLPQPIKYEELQREAYMALKFESFEGFKFDITKPLNQNFYVSHRMMLQAADVPAGGGQVVKTPVSDYTYGATVANEHGMLMGQMSSQGSMSARASWRASQHVALKLENRTVPERGQSMVMLDLELTLRDMNMQFKVGNGGFYGVNYMQSVHPDISVGGEMFYLHKSPQAGTSGVGAVIRHATAKHVATLQVATTGLLSCTYFHKVSDKAQVATDFLWNTKSNEATASIGYDYHFRACRLRGNIDSNGKVAAYLEEKLAPSVTLVLSGELDHHKRDHKFGFGMCVGE